MVCVHKCVESSSDSDSNHHDSDSNHHDSDSDSDSTKMNYKLFRLRFRLRSRNRRLIPTPESESPQVCKSQYVLFARAPAPHLGSFRNPFATARRQHGDTGASRSRACQSNTLTSVFRSRRTRYFNANIRDAPGHFSPRSTWHGSEHSLLINRLCSE